MDFITISKEKFYEVVDKVNDNFDKREDGSPIGEDNPLATMIMNLRNVVFAGRLADELFKNEEDK